LNIWNICWNKLTHGSDAGIIRTIPVWKISITGSVFHEYSRLFSFKNKLMKSQDIIIMLVDYKWPMF
jgi:hypothetical protein